MTAIWAKSSVSFSNGNCVEVTELPGGSVGVRNSRDPEGPVLRFTQDEWNAFLAGARLGEFDRFGTAASPDSPLRADDIKRSFFTTEPRLTWTEVVLPDLRNSLLVGTRTK